MSPRTSFVVIKLSPTNQFRNSSLLHLGSIIHEETGKLYDKQCYTKLESKVSWPLNQTDQCSK